MCYDKIDALQGAKRQMLRMFSMTLFFVILFFLASATNIFAIISHRITYYVAFVVLVSVLMAAFWVLRERADKGTKNEEDDM